MVSAGVARPEEFRASGGGTKSPLWRQIVADVLGVRLSTTQTAEGAAYGAAILAGVGAGWGSTCPELADAFVQVEGSATDPSSTGAYEAPYASFQGLYPALAPTFSTLERLRGHAARCRVTRWMESRSAASVAPRSSRANWLAPTVTHGPVSPSGHRTRTSTWSDVAQTHVDPPRAARSRVRRRSSAGG